MLAANATAGASTGDGQQETPSGPSASGDGRHGHGNNYHSLRCGLNAAGRKDNPQPQGAEQSSYDGNEPANDENEPQVLETTPEPANDNSPLPTELSATGTE